MAIGYTWNVSTVDTYPTKDSKSDVIYNVHWRLTATDIPTKTVMVIFGRLVLTAHKA